MFKKFFDREKTPWEETCLSFCKKIAWVTSVIAFIFFLNIILSLFGRGIAYPIWVPLAWAVFPVVLYFVMRFFLPFAFFATLIFLISKLF